MPVVDTGTGAVDVAIVGAGAAGIGAARRLAALRPALSVLVLEAGQRLGGRARTVTPPGLGTEPVDLGCGWLHGARTNAWTAIAHELGFIVDQKPAPWDDDSRDLGLDDRDQADCEAARGAYFGRVEARGDQEPDGAMADLLEPGNRWNGLLDAIGTYINGVELTGASIVDFNRYEPGPGPDWRVRHGYGQLVLSFGRSVPVALGTPVTRIDRRGAAAVTLETARGDVKARAVLVTVSTAVLATERLRFDPPLPEKTEAAAHLPLGLANKLFLHVAKPDDLPADGHLLGSPHRTGTGAYQIRPFGTAAIECYFGGGFARDLEAAGPEAALDFARSELADHFGHAIRDRLSIAAASAWAGDPLFGGSYSYAQPGASDGRTVLGAPIDGRLFFAGEACSSHRYSTAHGAYATGVAAAEAIAAQLTGS